MPIDHNTQVSLLDAGMPSPLKCAHFIPSDGWPGAGAHRLPYEHIGPAPLQRQPLAAAPKAVGVVWASSVALYRVSARLAPRCVGGLGALVLHPLCDAQADGAEYVSLGLAWRASRMRVCAVLSRSGQHREDGIWTTSNSNRLSVCLSVDV